MSFRKVAPCLILAILQSAALADEVVTVGVVFPDKHSAYEEVVEQLKEELAEGSVRLAVVSPDEAPSAPGRITSTAQAKALGKLAEADLVINFEAGRDAQLLGVASAQQRHLAARRRTALGREPQAWSSARAADSDRYLHFLVESESMQFRLPLHPNSGLNVSAEMVA